MAGVNVNSEIIQRQLLEMRRTAARLQVIQKNMLFQYQEAGNGWRDRKYTELGGIIQESSSALSQIQQILIDAEKNLNLLLKQVQEYEAVNLSGRSEIRWVNGQAVEIGHITQRTTTENDMDTVADDIYYHRMKPEDVHRMYENGVQSIDTAIENYREVLMERGVPDGEWMRTVLSQHRAVMVENLGYDLDQASGHGQDSANRYREYAGPEANPAFYDELVQQYRSSIAES